MNKDVTIEKRAGFTQGPWTSDWVGTKPNGSAVVWLGENTNKRIAVIGTGRDEANARLIANSPAMYDMLVKISQGNGYDTLTLAMEARELLANVDGGEG